MAKYKLGMVAAEFNYEITSLMVARAKAEAEFLGVEITKTIMVPGVFEVPLAAKKLVSDPEIDAVITLGAVIEGETEHDEVVMGQASRKVMDLSLEFNKPVAFGLTGSTASTARRPFSSQPRIPRHSGMPGRSG